MIDDQVARGGVEKGARIVDVRGIRRCEPHESGLGDVLRRRRTGAELRPHVAAKPFPVNEIQLGKLLPALAVHFRSQLENSGLSIPQGASMRSLSQAHVRLAICIPERTLAK